MRTILAGALLLSLLAAPARAGEGDYSVRATVGSDGAIRVVEEAELPADAEAPLNRIFFTPGAPGAFPLHQRVEGLTVTDGAGAALPWRSWTYARDRLQVAVDALPADRRLRLKYTILHAIRRGGDTDVVPINLTLYGWRPSLRSLTIEVALPAGVAADPSQWRDLVWDEGVSADDVIAADGALRRVLTEDLEEPRVEAEIRLPPGTVERLGLAGYWRELLRQAGLLLALLAAGLLAALVLRALPPGASIRFARGWHAALVLLPAVFYGQLVGYWLFAHRYTAWDDWWGNGAAEVVGALSLVGFLALFAVIQHRSIGARDREGYLLELAWPVVLLVVAPFGSDDPRLLLLPLLGLPIPLFWYRRRLALHFGVGSHAIAEAVAASGEAPLGAVAERLGLGRDRLLGVLRRQPELPVVIDAERDVLLTPEVAALRRDVAVCGSCGGVMVTRDMARLACPFCAREVTSSKAPAPGRPVPVIVEALARLLSMAGIAIVFWGAMFWVAVLAIEAFGGELLTGVALGGFLFAVGAFIGLRVRALGRELREGKRGALASTLMLLLSPLVVPLLAWRRLRSPQVRLHFGELPITALEAKVRERGELPLRDLATFLACSLAEASAFAIYVTTSHTLDAVYDRAGGRLVSRALYRTLSHEGACRSCGGLLSMAGGEVACAFCGAHPQSEQVAATPPAG